MEAIRNAGAALAFVALIIGAPWLAIKYGEPLQPHQAGGVLKGPADKPSDAHKPDEKSGPQHRKADSGVSPIKGPDQPRDHQGPAHTSAGHDPDKLAIDRRIADSTDRIAEFTDTLAAATIALAVFTLILAGVAVWQGIQLRSTDINTGIAARAARDTVQTMRVQMRAYIARHHARIDDVGPNLRPVASITLKNTGQTPANTLIVKFAIDLKRAPFPQTMPPIEEPNALSVSSLGAQGENVIKIPAGRAITPAEHQDIVFGRAAMFVWGVAEYVDIFGDPRTTRFCYVHSGRNAQISSPAMTVYSDGNDAT